MAGLFPDVRTADDFERIRRDEAALGPGVRAVCEALGLGDSSVRRFSEGSLPVYAIDDTQVLKLYPGLYASERDTEAAVLRLVDGRLPIPTPAVHAIGELDGWGYVLMERLRGEKLSDVWPQIPDAERARLAVALGQALAALHALDDPDLSTVRVDWNRFVEEQRRTAVDRQRQHGLERSWLEQIPQFLDTTPLAASRRGCLLHTEVMREHLLVERATTGWRLSGLFDFEPAMVGAPEYEFAAVGLFFSCGDARLLRGVLLAYGYSAPELGPELERRLLAYTLLHRYSNLAWYLERLPRAGATTLPELASLWWGVQDRASH